MSTPNWIDLAGVVNMRDLGGLPTDSGEVTQARRVLRSDNLQDLPPESVEQLVRDYHLTDVVDLRTHVEVAKEGDGPLRLLPQIQHHHLTLYREDTTESGIPAAERALPWESPARSEEMAAVGDQARAGRPSHDEFWSEHYLSYLATRPDSVVAALRMIAASEGAAIVHCAAGKDRTGTIVGLALKIVGVRDEDVIADYAASSERIEAILERLRTKPAYAANLKDKTAASQNTKADTMRLLLGTLEQRYDGVAGWLSTQDWTQADTDRMRRKLLS